MTKFPIITVFGLSGVGKSTLIRTFLSSAPQWTHLQAGSLIKEALASVDRDALRLVGNEQIMANQKLMIGKFWGKVKTANGPIIFDGHSVIDTGNELLKIPTEIIQQLSPQRIVFISASPLIIKERRDADTARKRPELSEETLGVQQEAAFSQAKIYADEIKIPLHRLESPDSEQFATVITANIP